MRSLFLAPLLVLSSVCFGQELGCTFEQADNYDPIALNDNGSCTFEGGTYHNPTIISTTLFDPCQADGFLRDESIASSSWTYEQYREALTQHIEDMGFGRVFIVELEQETVWSDFDGYGFDWITNSFEAWDVGCSYSAQETEWILSITVAFTNPCVLGFCQGCTNSEALNFDSTSNSDDGSCIFDTLICETTADLDQDGVIGINDLLILLSAFGDTDLDFDGIYDSVDDCVGEYDECGVCNGDGPSIPLIESIEILYDSLYADAIDEWWVFEVGADTSFYFVCELIEGCMDVTAYNYNELANADDGSCIYQLLGCMDQSACNYDPDAEVEDGSCEGLLGCMDPAAENYNSEATCDNESCAPYIGMYGFGGIVFDISGNTAYILNIHEEISVSAFQSEVLAAANALETNGYYNWTVPSSSMTELFCDQFELISLVSSLNDGIPLSGYYLCSQVGCTVNNVNTYQSRNISSSSCGSSCNCNQCPALLRAIRTQSF